MPFSPTEALDRRRKSLRDVVETIDQRLSEQYEPGSTTTFTLDIELSSADQAVLNRLYLDSEWSSVTITSVSGGYQFDFEDV